MKITTSGSVTFSLVALLTSCSTRSIQPPPSVISAPDTSSCDVPPGILKQATVMDPSKIKVHDGDTIKYEKKKFRFAGIDAPECRAYFGPGKGWSDQYGEGEFSTTNFCRQAKDFVTYTLSRAGEVKQVPVEADGKYGRTLAYVIVDGQLLQCELVKAGLAYELVTTYGSQGQESLAQIVLDAAQKTEPPHFEKPGIYRNKKR